MARSTFAVAGPSIVVADRPPFLLRTGPMVLLKHPMVLTSNDKLPGIRRATSRVARRLAQCWAPHSVLRVRHTFVATRLRWGEAAELKQTLDPITGH